MENTEESRSLLAKNDPGLLTILLPSPKYWDQGLVPPFLIYTELTVEPMAFLTAGRDPTN